jgi:hypothetical protein
VPRSCAVSLELRRRSHGRSFSAAGFHTSKTFFTDDDGVYVLDNDARQRGRQPDGSIDFDAVIADVRKRIRGSRTGAWACQQVPLEAHNTWVLTVPDAARGSRRRSCLPARPLLLPQNGAVVRDDITA